MPYITNEESEFLQYVNYKLSLIVKNITEVKKNNGVISVACFKKYDNAAPMRDSVDLKVNIQKGQKQQEWTAKELKELPYLKDLSFRITVDGIYQYRYRREGINKSFNSKNKDVARQKAYDFINQLKNNLGERALSIRGKNFDFIAQAWLSLKKNHVVPGTYRVYAGVYKNHIKPVFEKQLVKNILPMQLQDFFDDLFSRQEKTAEDSKIILNGIFEYAVANRLCLTNPMQAVIIEKHYREPGVALTAEQLKRFIASMLNDGGFGTAALIILYSGCRGWELSGIQFDWESGTMTIPNAKLKKSQKKDPKNLSRLIPINPKLYEIKNRIDLNDWRIKDSTLTCKFCKHWSENTVKDLRHTFASRARSLKVENELVNLWQGHLPGKNVTANVYTHFPISEQKIEADKLKDF